MCIVSLSVLTKRNLVNRCHLTVSHVHDLQDNFFGDGLLDRGSPLCFPTGVCQQCYLVTSIFYLHSFSMPNSHSFVFNSHFCALPSVKAICDIWASMWANILV